MEIFDSPYLKSKENTSHFYNPKSFFQIRNFNAKLLHFLLILSGKMYKNSS